MAKLAVDEIVQKFDLQSHPEGGFYKETFRSPNTLPHATLDASYHGDCSTVTQIYFLLPAGTFSALHRIPMEETWHFYLGEPLEVSILLVKITERVPEGGGNRSRSQVCEENTVGI